MATMRIKYLAISIMMQMHLQVFIPEKVFLNPGSKEAEEMKVLWLLHEEGGDCSDWLRLSMVEHFAEENNIALIMPNMDNSMHVDMAHGAYPYFTYMTTELPPYIRSLLPILPEEPQKNYVAGISTGGYGAVKWGLSNPGFFGGCASFSGEMDISRAIREKEKAGQFTDDWVAAFGSETFVKNNENDLFWLCRRNFEAGTTLPPVYLANTVKDESYLRNFTAVKKLQEYGLNITHVCEDQNKGWSFWNKQLELYIKAIAQKGCE